MVELTIGSKVGNWTLIRRGSTPSGHTAYYCECECGTRRWVQKHHLEDGTSKSCGCLFREAVKNRNKTHGMSGTRIYRIWRSMLTRCESPRHPTYAQHGARGISICKEWHEFPAFYKWAIETGYVDGAKLSLDRIDNNGNYCPENCRWANAVTQGNNRRTNKRIEINGRVKTLTQWAEEYGININTVNSRINQMKWDVVKAITTPVAGKKWEAMRKIDPSRRVIHRKEISC